MNFVSMPSNWAFLVFFFLCVCFVFLCFGCVFVLWFLMNFPIYLMVFLGVSTGSFPGFPNEPGDLV